MKKLLVVLLFIKMIFATGSKYIINDLTNGKEEPIRSRITTVCSPYVVIVTEYKDKEMAEYLVVKGQLTPIIFFWSWEVDTEKIVFEGFAKRGTSFKDVVREYLEKPSPKDPSACEVLRQLAKNKKLD